MLDEQLGRVEEGLRGAVQSPQPFLTQVAAHLSLAGGKRLRPALLLAAATAAGGGVAPDEAVLGGIAVELVHMGSLYHDDVIDEASSRRGVQSANARWGNLVAVLAGDFLLAQASQIAAKLGAEVVETLATTISRLCEGEMCQLQYSFATTRPEHSYTEAISLKTASLMSASTRVGALVARADQGEVEALARFGHAFGMAFQIWDDVRDLLCTEEELGKPAGHDMVEGTYTLPVLRALTDRTVGTELAHLLGQPLDEPTLEKARGMILMTDAIKESIAEGRRWADVAAKALMTPQGKSAPGANGSVELRSDQEVWASLAGLAHRLLDDLASRTVRAL